MSADRVVAAWRDLAGRLGLADGRAGTTAAFLVEQDSGASRHDHGLGLVARMLDVAEALPFSDRDAVGCTSMTRSTARMRTVAAGSNGSSGRDSPATGFS